mgnify:CR=1 FL=1
MSNKPIVTVNVTLQTATVSRKGFGTPLFISVHTDFAERVRTYSSLEGVAEDFISTDSAYIAAQAVFGNTPSVAAFKVGRRVALETAGDALAAILEEDEDFYFLATDDHTNTFVLAMAAAAEARTLLYFVSSEEEDAITVVDSAGATDLVSLLKQGNFERTVSMWSQVADTTFPECAFIGVNAPYAPDEQAVVWSGTNITVPIAKNAAGNSLTSTQAKNLFDRNCNYVTTTAVGIRQLGGKTASGEWIDNVHTRDTIVARVQEGQEALILNQAGGKLIGGKVGIALSDAAIQASLNPFVSASSLSSFTTDTTAATIDQNTRTLNNMKFAGVLAGSIIKVVINATLVNETV